MKLELGHTYSSRNGNAFTIVNREELLPGKANQTLYLGRSLTGALPQWFTEDGSWFLSGMNSELDLYSEVNYGNLAKSA